MFDICDGAEESAEEHLTREEGEQLRVSSLSLSLSLSVSLSVSFSLSLFLSSPNRLVGSSFDC